MPYPPRRDEPGALHHIGNRGISHAPLYIRVEDFLEFEGLLKRCVDMGELLIHAYCLMTNHFHLLAQSVSGGLSAAMRNLESMYVRLFNGSADRKGGLVCGRFWSRRIWSEAYLWAVIRYIHRNPSDARIVFDAGKYPFSSAMHYSKPSGPSWLERGRVEAYVREQTGLPYYDPSQFAAVLGAPPSDANLRWFEGLSTSRISDDPTMDDIVSGRSDQIRAWMTRRAESAFGGAPALIVADADTVRSIVAERAREWPSSAPGARPGRHSVPRMVQVALLEELAGQRPADISRATTVPRSSVDVLLKRHRTLMRTDAAYRDEVVATVVTIMSACHRRPT